MELINIKPVVINIKPVVIKGFCLQVFLGEKMLEFHVVGKTAFLGCQKNEIPTQNNSPAKIPGLVNDHIAIAGIYPCLMEKSPCLMGKSPVLIGISPFIIGISPLLNRNIPIA